jgi:hypothetical protein
VARNNKVSTQLGLTRPPSNCRRQWGPPSYVVASVPIYARYYTLIAQLEQGRGRIPSSKYLVWAQALGIEPDEFIRGLTSLFGTSLFL